MSNFPILNNFQVSIVSENGSTCSHYIAKGTENSWYVDMPYDNCVYGITLSNNNSNRCDALLEIDGNEAGLFRINPSSCLRLERPSYSQKRFTFFVGGSEGSKKAGYEKGNKTNGLIKVTFKPEREYIKKMSRKTPKFDFEIQQGLGEDSEEISEEYCSNDDVISFTKKKHVSRGGFQDCCFRDQYENLATKAIPMSINSSVKEGMTGLSGSSSQKFETVPRLDYDKNKETVIMLRLVYRDEEIEPLRKIKSTGYPNPVC